MPIEHNPFGTIGLRTKTINRITDPRHKNIPLIVLSGICVR
ncbi:hypothetical protein DOT_6232 [Desulfosporosinus sp. OT]|nr:hypothetical protein DOT_6232 [Desulfosporosinus sp. OT]